MNLPRRPPRRAVDGVLLLDKAIGVTSNTALQAVRRLYNAAKAGHTGTLDPLASGLLPLCFGEATKFAGELLGADKEYEATMRLGVVTDSGDADGTVLDRRPVNVGADQVDVALKRMTGSLMQVPPMHSALKRDGKPLYEYARAGINVDRAPRPVVIHRLELTQFSGDEVGIRLLCSKGTYVRTLAQDIGNLLGCGAHLTALRRTQIGSLRIEEATTMVTLQAMADSGRDALLRPTDALLDALPQVKLAPGDAERFAHGQTVRGILASPGERLRIYDDHCFLGLGEVDADGNVRPKRLLAR
jgi:tRNA pseudouridine55 synthase